MTVRRGTDTQNVVRPYQAMSSSRKEEDDSSTCCRVDEPRGHDAEGLKPGTEGQASHDPAEMQCPGQQTHGGVAGDGEGPQGLLL